VTTFTVEVESY